MVFLTPPTIPRSDTGKIYFKGLNGLRAIASLAVVISHTNMALIQFNLSALPTLKLAGFGVTIFFSLSGFLITYLLLTEKKAYRNIHIAKFYLRRILRIWPLYFLYLFIAVGVAHLSANISRDHHLFYYLFFVPNVPFVFGGVIPLLAHYWSLGVEEQFYCFWPWVIKYIKRLFLFLFSFVFVFLLLKALANLIWGGNSLIYTFLYATRFDCMAIGAIGACILFYQKDTLLSLILNRVSEVGAWVILLFVSINQFHIASIIDHEIIALVTVILILNQCAYKNPLINMETRFFDFIGRISFGIYVYHPLVIFSLTFLSWNIFADFYLLKIAAIYTTIIGLTMIVSYLSHRYFERPALILKEKFTIVGSLSSNKFQ